MQKKLCFLYLEGNYVAKKCYKKMTCFKWNGKHYISIYICIPKDSDTRNDRKKDCKIDSKV